MRLAANDRHYVCPRLQDNLPKENTMTDEKEKSCAHEPCQCTVPAHEKYCSDWCRDAGAEEVEIACECNHPPCQ